MAMLPPASDETTADWPEALATVLSCRYDMRAGRALLGAPGGRHFRIAYNYFADGAHHTAELYSAVAMPQGMLFPIRYDPALPASHWHAHSSVTPNPRRTTLLVGVAGSLVLSLAWLAVLHGCR